MRSFTHSHTPKSIDWSRFSSKNHTHTHTKSLCSSWKRMFGSICVCLSFFLYIYSLSWGAFTDWRSVWVCLCVCVVYVLWARAYFVNVLYFIVFVSALSLLFTFFMQMYKCERCICVYIVCAMAETELWFDSNTITFAPQTWYTVQNTAHFTRSLPLSLHHLHTQQLQWYQLYIFAFNKLLMATKIRYTHTHRNKTKPSWWRPA